LEARGGIEPPLKALQAFAFPLGDRAAELVSLLPTATNFCGLKHKTHRPFTLAVGA
jgi:hypothetical protein